MSPASGDSSKQPPKIPPLKRHANGTAHVCFRGRRYYFGPWGSERAAEGYERFVRRLLAGDFEPGFVVDPADAVVLELVGEYLDWSATYYVRDGQPGPEHGEMARTLSALVDLYGDVLGRDAGPRWITTLQQHFTRAGHSRGYVNKSVNRVRRFIRWCCARELLPPELYHRLAVVEPLKKGRCTARETAPVKPVPLSHVSSTLPHLSPTVAAMVRVQYLCGMRPQDVCCMRPADIDRSGPVWLYTPAAHKNAWRGQSLVKAIPAAAQSVLTPFLDRSANAWCFSPAEAEAWRMAELRAKRKTPVQPSQRRRCTGARAAAIQRRYSTTAYARAIRRAAVNARVPHWSPNQLRHAIATQVANLLDHDAAQHWLGHADPNTTAIYTAREVARLHDIATMLDQAWSESGPFSSGEATEAAPASNELPSAGP